MDLRRQEVPYYSDSSQIFHKFAHMPWAIFLDSGKPGSEQGRFDIISNAPHTTLVTRGEKTVITQGQNTQTSREDPFVLLQRYVKKKIEPIEGLPFCGGAMGYFAYDLGRRIEHMPSLAMDDLQVADMAVGIYPWALIVDHQQHKSVLVGDMTQARVRMNWDDLIESVSSVCNDVAKPEFSMAGEVASNMSAEQYADAFVRVKHYIRAGDCYQINLAQRFQASVIGEPWSAYRILRSINPSPFAAYINLPDVQVLSASPERFLSVQGSKVETKPIKGTRPRHADPQHDRELKEELAASRKDQAENVMIVDLLRNDLSKACRPGSVQVPKLFAIESFPTVHHLVSTVTGELRENSSALAILRASFPGGSITGAPKIRAMQIIEELEPHRRNIYCGSIGYIGFDGNMDTNIAIRTIMHKDQHMYFHAGGGIVWDSEQQSEYQETYDKAAAMLQLLGAR